MIRLILEVRGPIEHQSVRYAKRSALVDDRPSHMLRSGVHAREEPAVALVVVTQHEDVPRVCTANENMNIVESKKVVHAGAVHR